MKVVIYGAHKLYANVLSDKNGFTEKQSGVQLTRTVSWFAVVTQMCGYSSAGLYSGRCSRYINTVHTKYALP
jgi:hypothetical protein